MFSPRIDGSVPIRTGPARFLEGFRRRVEAGLVSGQPQPRSRYLVIKVSDARIEVAAADWSTAVAVGLNEVEIHAPGNGRAAYTVRYRRWAAFVLVLSGIIGITLLATFWWLDLPTYVEQNPGAMIPGLSTRTSVGLAWGMAGFWGFVFPWLLIAGHKPTLRRLIEGIIRDVDTHEGP